LIAADDQREAGFGGWRDWLTALACAIAVAACILATLPIAELPFNDDFSYSFTARELAQSGHLIYNGWASAALGPQAYWGALFIKLFGFSFTVTRLSTLPIAAAIGAAGYALARSCGLQRSLAILSSLTLAISPLFLPLAASFMTDAMGLLLAIVSLHMVITAGQTKTTRRAITCIIALVILALIAGTVRQIMWMTAIMGLPCIAWLRRTERSVAIAALIGWFFMIAGAWITLRWFDTQPYAIPERPISLAISQLRHAPEICLGNVWALLLTLTLWTLPAIIPSLPAIRQFRRWQWAIAVVVFVSILVARHQKWIPASAPWIGNTITWTGVMNGQELGAGRPPILPGKLWALLSFTTYAAISLGVAMLCGFQPFRKISTERWIILTLILFGLGYFALVMPRTTYNRAYDRYVLPLYPCITIPMLLIWQRLTRTKPSRNWARIGWVTLSLFALFGIGLTQELLGLSRARAAAAAELAATGIPRTQIDAGFEYNFWTQLDQQGHLNDERIINPPGTFKPGLGPIPACQPRYRVEFKQPKIPADEQPTNFAPVIYFSYLPPFHRTLVIRKILGTAKITGEDDRAKN
jgi:hypothetical protein